MKALTIWAEWAWAIAHAGKDVENRTWSPPDYMVGEYLAIHAGKKFEVETIDRFQSGSYGEPATWCPDAEDLKTGCIVAVARVVGWMGEGSGIMVPGVKHEQGNSIWFCGPIGWLLADVDTLQEPVPCRGAQGLWNVPEPAFVKVVERLER